MLLTEEGHGEKQLIHLGLCKFWWCKVKGWDEEEIVLGLETRSDFPGSLISMISLSFAENRDSYWYPKRIALENGWNIILIKTLGISVKNQVSTFVEVFPFFKCFKRSSLAACNLHDHLLSNIRTESTLRESFVPEEFMGFLAKRTTWHSL